MSFVNKVWRVGVLGLVAVTLVTAACADDEGAAFGTPEPVLGSISGTVTIKGTTTPIVGALVGTSPATSTALTDAQGRYAIQNIPLPSTGSASFAVTAAHPDFITGPEGTATVSLSEASPNATANLQLTTPTVPPQDTLGNLQVLVTDRNGVAQSGATVVARRAGATDSLTGTTDANGFVIFNAIAPGAYTVTATKVISGITFRASGGVQVRPRETAFIQLTLARDFGQTVFPNIRGGDLTPEQRAALDIDLRATGARGFTDNNPDIDCNVIRTQHLFIARVVTRAAGEPAGGTAVSGVKVQWDLNISENGTISIQCPESADDPAGCTLPTVPGNTGSIVDSDDPDLDPFRARTGLNPAFILETRKAVTFTNDQTGPNNVISFNNTSVTVGEGESWIIITSPVEGVTDLIVASSDITNTAADCGLDANPLTRCDKDFAIKRWVNWDTRVFELVWPNAGINGDHTVGTSDATNDPHKDPAAVFTPIARGSTFTNVLSRGVGAICPGPIGGLAPAQLNICRLAGDDHLFISEVRRLRFDSPFNISRGDMVWVITDDVPDINFFGEDPAPAPPDTDGCSAGVCNVENNGPTDDEFGIVTVTRDVAFGEFDANNNIFDGGIVGHHGDEDDFIGWMVVETQLNPAIFFCTDADFDGDCNPGEPGGDTFSPAYQALIDGTADNTAAFQVIFLDEFGEVCAVFDFKKRFVTSRITVIKNAVPPGAATRQLVEGFNVKTHDVLVGETFNYTITVINDGEVLSRNVRITDTLPRLGDQFSGPPDLGAPLERNGNQAFQYVSDRPAFDPQAIVFGVDSLNDEAGDEIDRCIVGRQAGNANAAAYVIPEICRFAAPFNAVVPTVIEAGTVEQARTAAISASRAGDQIVFIQWYDESILGRTPVDGGIESEDTVEVTLLANPALYQPVNPLGPTVPFVACDIATATDGPQNRGTRDVASVVAPPGEQPIVGGAPIPQSLDADTLCHRVLEALLDIRKTAVDAVVTAGDSARFIVEVSNAGSAPLTNVVVHDTVDAALLLQGRKLQSGDIRLHPTNCVGCTVTINPDSFSFSVTIPSLSPGGFREIYRLVVPVTTIPGTFCNRVTARATRPSGVLVETDISCIRVLPGAVELDVSNEDGFRDAAGAFQSQKEVFRIGDGGAAKPDSLVYEVVITNRSTVFDATNVVVVDSVAPNTGIIEFRAVITGFPTGGTVGTVTATSNAGFTWTIGTLGPGGVATIQFRAEAVRDGNDVNKVVLSADQLSAPRIDEEPTTVVP